MVNTTKTAPVRLDSIVRQQLGAIVQLPSVWTLQTDSLLTWRPDVALAAQLIVIERQPLQQRLHGDEEQRLAETAVWSGFGALSTALD